MTWGFTTVDTRVTHVTWGFTTVDTRVTHVTWGFTTVDTRVRQRQSLAGDSRKPFDRLDVIGELDREVVFVLT